MPRSPASASPVLADYDVVGVLGCGSFGSVSRVRRKTDGAEFACKSVPYGGMAEKHKHLLVSEVNIMRTLRHAHIVKYVDRINDRDTGTLHIIMELCPGGDLASLLKRQRAKRRGLDERAVWQLVGQVAAALRDCHEGCFSSEVDGAAPKKPVLHRDLKPANILFDGRGDVKVADFGLAIELKNAAALAQTCLGTPLYMAPEVVKQQPYGPPADVWSLGCVAYEACALEPPFCADTMAALNADIVAGRLRKPLPRTYSPALRKLVSAMLNSDAAARPTAAAVAAETPRARPKVAADSPRRRAPFDDAANAAHDANAGAGKAAARPRGAAAHAGGAREAALDVREASLARREAALRDRTKDLDAARTTLDKRERALERAAAVQKRTAPLPPPEADRRGKKQRQSDDLLR